MDDRSFDLQISDQPNGRTTARERKPLSFPILMKALIAVWPFAVILFIAGTYLVFTLLIQ